MDTAKEYRDYADECVAWAKDAQSDTDRETFLKMARDWLRAATLVEAQTTPAPKDFREPMSPSGS
jgi:hypothetical protein